jgi:hypothetical protein
MAHLRRSGGPFCASLSHRFGAQCAVNSWSLRGHSLLCHPWFRDPEYRSCLRSLTCDSLSLPIDWSSRSAWAFSPRVAHPPSTRRVIRAATQAPARRVAVAALPVAREAHRENPEAPGRREAPAARRVARAEAPVARVGAQATEARRAAMVARAERAERAEQRAAPLPERVEALATTARTRTAVSAALSVGLAATVEVPVWARPAKTFRRRVRRCVARVKRAPPAATVAGPEMPQRAVPPASSSETAKAMAIARTECARNIPRAAALATSIRASASRAARRQAAGTPASARATATAAVIRSSAPTTPSAARGRRVGPCVSASCARTTRGAIAALASVVAACPRRMPRTASWRCRDALGFAGIEAQLARRERLRRRSTTTVLCPCRRPDPRPRLRIYARNPSSRCASGTAVIRSVSGKLLGPA